MKFVFSLLICFSLALVAKGQFCCNDLKTQLRRDQVCNGISECPMTETTHGGEDEEGCEGSGDEEQDLPDGLDWCRTEEEESSSGTIGLTFAGPLLPALLSVLWLL